MEEEAVMDPDAGGGDTCSKLLRGGSPIALSYLNLSVLVLIVKLNDADFTIAKLSTFSSDLLQVKAAVVADGK